MRAKVIRPVVAILLWALWCTCTPWTVSADGTDSAAASDGDAPQRAVKVYRFDFEAVHPRADEVWLPDRWERVATGPESPDFDLGHPFYNESRLVRETQDGKVINHYLEMVLHKGKVSYQTKAGMREKKGEGEAGERFVSVNSAKSYRLTARIMTEGFEQPGRPTAAYVSILWFARPDDGAICRYRDGAPMIFRAGAVRRDTGGKWQEISLTVDTVPPGAEYLKLRCTLEGKGIKARAMFDDVMLSEGPRVTLDTGRPVPIFAEGERVEVAVTLSGLAAGGYNERILVEDEIDGRDLHEEVRHFQADGGNEKIRRYELKAESFGTFRLLYSLKDESGSEVAARSTVIARIPENKPLRDMERYGVRLDFFENPCPVIGRFVRASGAGSIKTPLWGEGETRQELLRFLAAMRRMSVTTVGVLGRSPDELTGTLGLSVPLQGNALFDQPRGPKRDALWKYLKEDLAGWADVLEAVQPGRDFDTPYTRPVDEIVAAFNREMDRPLSSAALVFPVSAAAGAPWPQGAGIVALSVPASMTRQELSERLSEAPDSCSAWVSLELLSCGPAQVDDLFRKMTVCLAARVDRIFLPLDVPGAGLMKVMEFPNESGELTPAFAAFRFITQMIDGAESAEELSVPGVRMYLFEKDDESLMVMWSEGGQSSLSVYWGEGLRMHDAVGNCRDLPSIEGETAITGLDESPCIVSGIDPRLLRTWRSLRFVTKSIESRVVEQPVEVGIANHFDKEIFGTVRLEFDEELRHLQRRATAAEFRIGPGESWSSGGAFVLKPSISDALGRIAARAVVRINTNEGSFTLNKTLEVEMVPADLSLEVTRITAHTGPYRAGRPGEIVVKVAVSNRGSSRAAAGVYAAVEDGPRRRRRVSIPRLEPGEQAEAEFRIQVDPGSLPRRIWLGLREIHGRRFANIYIDQDEIRDVFNR